jgi:hypothetical protein
VGFQLLQVAAMKISPVEIAHIKKRPMQVQEGQTSRSKN